MSRVGRTSARLLAICVWVTSGGNISAQNPRGASGPIAQLAARAQASGSVRVIVRLQVPAQPEGTLPGPQRVSAQRTAIANAQQRLVGRLRAAGRPSHKRFATIPYLALEATAADLAELSSNPNVATVVEDVPVPPTLTQSTSLIKATAMSALNYRGDGWTVAVLDTGVDATHPFLGGRVVSQACYSSTVGSFQSLCPGGLSSSTAPGSAQSCSGYSGCDHGTHVAGIAAGAGSSFNGVAPDAGIIAIQIFSGTSDGSFCAAKPCVLSYTSDQMLGLEHVYALRSTFRIAAVNMSLGGGAYMGNCDSDPRKGIIDQLREAGTATIIAAGNGGYSTALSAPGCISSAVSVGATTDGSSGSAVDTVSWFSNSASFLSLLAPGQNVVSSVPGGGFATFSGTSMAAPHIAGAWTVLKGRNPAASVDEILAALSSSGVPVTDPRNGVTKRRINLDSARSFLPVGCSLDVSTAATSAPYYGYSGTLTVTAPSGCAWRVTNISPAIMTITSGEAGVGDGTLLFTVKPNATGALRTAMLQLREGEIALTRVVTQIGIPTIAGDMSGDSRPDLVWQNQSTNALGLWVMEGSELRDTPPFSPNVADPGRQIVATTDIDGDGNSDLVFQDIAAGVLEAWLMTPGNVRSSVQPVGPVLTDTDWRAVGSGDFNSDGRVDLMLRHETSGALSVWFLNGTTRIGTGVMNPAAVDPAWKIRGVGDFNRDDKPDLVWQHTSGALAVWFMDGVNVQDTRYLTIASVSDPAWQVVGVADVNRDLRSDLLWQHQAGGWIAVWYMWDNMVLDTSFLSPNRVADTNWKLRGPK